jgi:Caspase domain
MDKSFLEIKSLLQKSHKDPSKSILLYVYYSGHGILDNTTKMVMNEDDPIFRYFDLEQKLSCLSKLSNNFISAIFDCCREELAKTDTRSMGDKDDQSNLTD